MVAEYIVQTRLRLRAVNVACEPNGREFSLSADYKQEFPSSRCLLVTGDAIGNIVGFSSWRNAGIELLSFILPHLQAEFKTNPRDSHRTAAGPGTQYLFQIFAFLFWHPYRIFSLWNWKSACLSILLRTPIFVAATVRSGWRVALAAVLVECFVCAVTAGFYGALIQNLKDAKPVWLTAVFITVVVPAIFQFLEAYLHWIRGTPHLRIAEAVSLFVSAISSLFNWYAMKRGALLVGVESDAFGSDLRRLPVLLFSFVKLVPRYFAKGERGPTDEPY